MSALQDKRLKMPKVDLKKKPTYELLTLIGKQASQDISPHPFTKMKKPKEEKIEEIFIKGGKKSIADKQSSKNKNQKPKKKIKDIKQKKKFKKKSN